MLILSMILALRVAPEGQIHFGPSIQSFWSHSFMTRNRHLTLLIDAFLVLNSHTSLGFLLWAISHGARLKLSHFFPTPTLRAATERSRKAAYTGLIVLFAGMYGQQL